MSNDDSLPVKKMVEIGSVYGNVYLGDSPEYEIDTAINELLLHLAGQPFTYTKSKRRPSSQTTKKILHNNIQSRSHIIRQYLAHSSKVEEAFNGIDSIVAFGKSIILQNLDDLYHQALDAAEIEHLTCDVDINKIREKSEFILDFIIKKLRVSAIHSKNTPILKEHIDLGVNVVVAHAFIECIVLENPDSDS